jgi:hypothetical protein
MDFCNASVTETIHLQALLVLHRGNLLYVE